ncbi:N,N-dimethylformamidase beta subunit family domain-containing protein [Ktedonobacter racemifer]|uniref:Abnormal spindle-like microcephaly-associated protein ASH domain-containing protein n=1 Tax=Ktedonobacter racemifer DSM 44963 TaxID=485913 RepID=D6TS78_KTERA|nr:N,N-dimethylformamidase beta subunit family domain-containing protein [Ktedonobacter racemifer]EFH83279.1 hypothetical protein Krac_4222 [Ktedonobacter racemifer DSM 44963]
MKKLMSRWRPMRIILVCLLIVAALPVIYVTARLVVGARHATQNAIQIENSKPGTDGWNDFASDLQYDLISGYGSKISVNHGDSLDLYVTTTAPSFSIDVFRTGWYGGIGARKVTSLGSFTGVHQPMPNPDPKTGLIDCNWTKTTTLNIPSDWVTGVYLAKLTTSTNKSSFIFFVVRDDGGHEDIVFQTSVTTYQAYNTWGGTGLYNNETNRSIFSGAHASKVSFNRPFRPGDSNGAGHYFFWEYKFVRWAESRGYDLTYTTDIDTAANTNPLTNHKAFLSVGHDEYWTKSMRDNVENAIKAGVNVGFFGANTSYWQIRLESDSKGVANRIEVGYKDFAQFNTPPGPDPMFNVDNSVLTDLWRDPHINRPENGMAGVMYEQQVYQDYTFVAKNTSHWIYAGTGFTDGSKVPGIIGYEYDRVFDNGATPPGLTVLGSSPVNACCGTGNSHADTTIYTAPSGARVFASGTIQWSLGLDNSQGNTYANAGIQQMTANLLNNFISAAPPGVSLNPGSINFGNQNVNTASSPQSLTLINNGSSALTINSIGITGGSASDFSQSNTCPISPSTLAAHSSCTISVTYQPSAQGNSSATLTINDDASGSPHTTALTGAGVVPAPGSSLSPTSLDFGTQNLSIASGAKQITLTNNGTAALTINNIGISGTNASDYTQSNSCPASSSTLAPNASCTINVTFTPAGLGSRSATLTVNDSAAGSPYAIALTGTGVNSTIYFSDGFEGGNTSLWSLPNSDGSGSITVESSQVHSGTKAAAITNGSNQYAYLYAPLSSAQAHTYTRFYVRLASTTYGSIVAIGRNQNNGSIWEVDYDNVTHAFDIYFWGASNQVYSISTLNNSVNANTWYSLEIQDFQDQAGHAQVWLNGASQGSIDQNLSTGNPFQRIMMYSNAQTTLYFDDVQVASNYNGPTSGE